MLKINHFLPSLLNGRGYPLWVGVSLFLACQQADFDTYEEPEHTHEVVTHKETLVVTNDTARIYMAHWSIDGITLRDYPTPHISFAANLSPYRMPTKLEAQALHLVRTNDSIPLPDYRMLCYDEQENTYYTFLMNNSGMITKAGWQTKYSIQPIRVELLPIIENHLTININDQWE